MAATSSRRARRLRRTAVAGRRCLDAGASTGGFTDVLLSAGAAHVVAVDVGYGQLAWALRTDPRVTVLDRVNVRSLQPEQVAPPPGPGHRRPLVHLADPGAAALVACAAPDADFVLLVKPQFEVGKDKVGAAGGPGPGAAGGGGRRGGGGGGRPGPGRGGVTASPLPGRPGNVEYFLWLRRGAPPLRRRGRAAAGRSRKDRQ